MTKLRFNSTDSEDIVAILKNNGYVVSYEIEKDDPNNLALNVSPLKDMLESGRITPKEVETLIPTLTVVMKVNKPAKKEVNPIEEMLKKVSESLRNGDKPRTDGWPKKKGPYESPFTMRALHPETLSEEEKSQLRRMGIYV